MKEKMKKLIIATTLSAAISALNPVSANAGWFNAGLGYDTKNELVTSRLEGGKNLSDKLNAYGFIDIDSTKENKNEFENFYGEARLSYSLGDINKNLENVSLSAEQNVGNNYDDTTRLGLTWTPNIYKDNFTLIKAFPFETAKEKGAQVSIFSSQNIGENVSLSLLVDYNIEDKNMYVEPEVSMKLTDNSSIYVQGRGFGDFKKMDFQPVIGVKYSF